NTVKKLPGAGDLPIVGALFKSTSFRRGETELVIVVTPYLVKPVNASDIKLPTDGHRNPNTLQQVFGNQENAGQSGASRPLPTAAPDQSGLPPKVGELDIPTPLQNPRPGAGDKEAKKNKRRSRSADAADATPGFDL
ncbi:MAG: secretion system protein, partial [Sphingomonadales bacterium]|nr:secretion system protein [Sphingomonadales bacterium]